MAITSKYIIVCDDVRREDNGKIILIGIYLPDMAVPQIPFAMPTLTFFLVLDSDRPGNFPFRMKLEHLESGKALVEGMGAIPINVPGQVVMPIKMGNVQFAGAGAYSFSLTIDGQKEPIVTSFNVILVIPGAPQQSQRR